MPSLMLLEHVFGSWSMMSFPMPWKRGGGGAVRPADEFEPAVDDDVLVGLGDAAAADQDGRVGRPPLVQWDDDAHSRPPIQPIRKASARRIIAVWLMPFLRSPGWPASR